MDLCLMNAFYFWIIVLYMSLFVMPWIPYGINWIESFGLIPRKSPMFASVREWNFCSLMNVRFARSVSKMPVVPSNLEPYLSWDTVCVESKVNERYVRLVMGSVLISGNICSYVAPNRVSLLWAMRVSGVMIAAVSSMTLMASKIRLWTSAGSILDALFSGRISSVHRLVKGSLSTVAAVAWAMHLL